MDKADTLKNRIRSGKLKREDVARRLAELAFGKANDCVKLVLADDTVLEKLDLPEPDRTVARERMEKQLKNAREWRDVVNNFFYRFFHCFSLAD